MNKKEVRNLWANVFLWTYANWNRLAFKIRPDHKRAERNVLRPVMKYIGGVFDPRGMFEPVKIAELLSMDQNEYYDPMYDYQIEKNKEKIIFRGSAEEIETFLEVSLKDK